MTNPYEAVAREKKALRLAMLLKHNGCSAKGAAGIDEDHRKIAAKLVEVGAPSERTWRRVVEILAMHERQRAEILDPIGGDLFDGLGPDQTRKGVAA